MRGRRARLGKRADGGRRAVPSCTITSYNSEKDRLARRRRAVLPAGPAVAVATAEAVGREGLSAAWMLARVVAGLRRWAVGLDQGR